MANIPENLCYYLTVNSLESILKSGYFCASNIKRMNDLDECKGINQEESNNIFCFCLNAGKHENIPLWYLYSGIKGDGIRLEFTRSTINKLIGSIKTVYRCNKNFTIKRNSKPLKKGKDFEIEFDWIYYRNTKSSSYFYKNKWFADCDLEENPKTYFIKDCAWRFETEFRIAIIFKKNPKCYRIGIPFLREFIDESSIRIAPEANVEEVSKKLKEQGIVRINESDLNCSMNLTRKK